MAKPRTNADTIEYWAESICDREPAPYIQVNSIIVDNDVVYSFGRHYPMGVIERDSRGKTKRVILNSDFFPVKGWANTPGDQREVGYQAHHYASLANVPVVERLLSAYRTGGKAQVRPRPDDPEPPAHVDYEVPAFFTAADPGPEPVDEHHEKCIAGEIEVRTERKRILANARDLRARPDDWADVDFSEWGYTHRDQNLNVIDWIDYVLTDKSFLSIWCVTTITTITVWSEKSYERVEQIPGEDAHRIHGHCPHCEEFQKRHEDWRVRMYGGYPRWVSGKQHRRVKGWQQFIELVMRYEPDDLPETLDGSWDMRHGIDGWKEARRQDAKRVTAARKKRKEWEERNLFDLGYVPKKSFNTAIPDLDADGFIKRKYVEQWKREERERQRAKAAQEHAMAIELFCTSKQPAVFPGPRGKPLAAIFPRTSEAYAPSLVLVKGTIHNRDKEEILLTASARGNRIEYVDTRELTRAATYIKND